ncbi:MAG: nitrous oxide reductase family maturation protein NosD, partial [Rhodospirillales bacterium]|nr:nitrous oxide reductase family maturation protein NosD [Rhodospirillales bacterium]
MRFVLILAVLLSTQARADIIDVSPETLAQIVASANPGDTLRLSKGIYQGPVALDIPLTLQGLPGAVIDGGGTRRVISVNAPDCVVRGLLVRNSGDRLDLMDAGIYIERTAHRARVENNHLEGNLFGVYVQGPKDALVRNNVIIGRKDLRVNERGNGVQIWNSPGTVIEGNRISFGRDGIFSTTSKHNIFRGNRFENVRFAVHYMYTNHSEISGNVSIGNHVGYALMFSHHMKVFGNSSTNDRDHGILLNYANNSTFRGNAVRDGGGKCVFIYNSNKNRFTENLFSGCGIGVHFTAGSERNAITGNSFVDNETQVKYVGTRWLEWSRNGRGNFWSDNPAFDLNGDGIADTAFRPNDMV